MSIGLIKGNSSVFIKEEITEGIFVAPASVNDALQVLSDGVGFEYTRAEIERNILSSTIEVEASRVGLPSISGTIPTELTASSIAGNAPKTDVLYKSLLGGKHQLTSQVITGAGHTTTRIFMVSSGELLFKKGMVVKFLIAGAHVMRPVGAIGSGYIDLAIALASAPADNVVIEKATTYFQQDGAPTFSATHYMGGQIEEQVAGLRAISCSLEGWETASTASTSFTVEGLSLERSVGAPAFTPNFSGDALPPVLLGACIFLNGVSVPYSTFSLSMENKKSEILSICADQGKLGSRFTQFAVTGEINPYMSDSDVAKFDLFNLNDDMSVFGYAYNPTAVAGEFKEAVAFYLPQTKITAIPSGDQDDVLTDNVAFKSYRKDGGDSVFLSFI